MILMDMRRMIAHMACGRRSCRSTDAGCLIEHPGLVSGGSADVRRIRGPEPGQCTAENRSRGC